MSYRIERDALGSMELPAEALYGIQTERARRNFPISGLRPLEPFVIAQVWIKKAAALTHGDTGRLDSRRVQAIVAAADEVLAGAHRDQFIVDPYQAGAGTSHNMNVNEVLANRANELLGVARGVYAPVHPNDHVNLAQSTNDTIPTNIRLAILRQWPVLRMALDDLTAALHDRGDAFDPIVKAGRTHLQDAMPIRLGQEFHGYAGTMERARRRLDDAVAYLQDLGIGGSAVGTGVLVQPEYPARMVTHLRTISGIAGLRVGADRVQLMQSMGDITAFSAALRGVAIDLSQIMSDIRLMASGPRTGLDELHLPAVQPGSSMMPGKVNPALPEMVNQVCFQVIGCDTTIAMSAEHGQLELNVMMPVIAHNVLLALQLLTNAIVAVTTPCIRGITANPTMCSHWVERSAALATALLPSLGYEGAAALAQQSVREGVLIRELVRREGLLSPGAIDRLLDLRRMTEIGIPGAEDPKKPVP